MIKDLSADEMDSLEVFAEDLTDFLSIYAEEDYQSVTPEDLITLMNTKFRKFGN